MHGLGYFSVMRAAPHNPSLCSCALLLTSLDRTGWLPVSSVDDIVPAPFARAVPFRPGTPWRTAISHPELHLQNVPLHRPLILVLIVDDPDAPAGLWTHWLVWNLPPETATSIAEGKLPPKRGREKNSFGHVRYDGPAPPSGTHRYFFRVYALDTMLALPAGANREALLKAMGDGHVVATGETLATLPGCSVRSCMEQGPTSAVLSARPRPIG